MKELKSSSWTWNCNSTSDKSWNEWHDWEENIELKTSVIDFDIFDKFFLMSSLLMMSSNSMMNWMLSLSYDSSFRA